ncbi:hypothetical protein D3C71_1551630 [compost metagenome]
MYVVKDNELFFHLPHNVEKECTEELDAIFTACILLNKEVIVRKPTLEEKIESSMSAEWVLDFGEGNKVYFDIAFNGFIKKIIIMKGKVEISQYFHDKQLEAIKEIKYLL